MNEWHIVNMTSEQHTLRFCAANKFLRSARSEATAKQNAEPCDVEETFGAVLQVHQGVGSAPNNGNGLCRHLG